MPYTHAYDPSMPNLLDMSPTQRRIQTLPLIEGLRPIDIYRAYQDVMHTVTETSLAGTFITDAAVNAPYMVPDALLAEILAGRHGYLSPAQREKLEEVARLRTIDAKTAIAATGSVLVPVEEQAGAM
jgi:hypothetical protein